MFKLVLTLFALLFGYNAQSIMKELFWSDGGGDLTIDGRSSNEVSFQLSRYTLGREVIDNNDRNNKEYIVVNVGNVSGLDVQYKNLKNVEIYRNGKPWIKTIHKGLDDNKNNKRKMIFVADRYVLPKNTHKIKLLSTDAQGGKRDFNVKLPSSVTGKSNIDITKRFRFNKIRWKKRIPLYKTIAYAKEEDLVEITETIKNGIALTGAHGFVLDKNIYENFYGNCIVNEKNNYITGYTLKIKNKRISPKELTLINATLSEKLQYLSFTHRVLLTSVSCPFDYNQQTRMEVTLTCTTNQNKTFVDKRYIYLPFINFPVGPSGCDYDLPPFSYSTGEQSNE